MKNKIKRLISLAACAIAATSVTMFAVGCNNGGEKDGFDLDSATPTNTYTYDIPQDYCRTYYELFVHSFADSDGDDSTTSDLGINGIWLMPIHQSPSYHKYDVTDYYSIADEYGTIEDFKDLVKACDERDIWLQMDLVLNHTATNHEWFERALKDAKRGYEPEESAAMQKYNFVRTADKPTSGMWYQVSGTDLWYLGNFSHDMPDVNLANEEVRDEIKNIVDYWLELGVRSFRLDAVPWAFENSVSYSDENSEFWTWFNDYCDEKGEEVYGEKYPNLNRYCYNVGEVLTTSQSVISDFYSTGMSNFNFVMGGSKTVGFVNVLESNSASAAALVNQLSTIQNDFIGKDPAGLLSNILSNHDTDRSAGFLGYDAVKIKKAAGLYLLAPGNPYIYYGEEIGASGSRGGSTTDANRRLHFNWGDSRNTNDPVGADYTDDLRFGTQIQQSEDKNSILTYYRQAIRLRNRFPEIGRGKMTAYAVDADGKLVQASALGAATGLVSVNSLNKTVAAYTLEYKGTTTLIVHNIGDDNAAIDLSVFDGCDVVGAVKANGGRVVLRDGKLNISGGISAVIKAAD